MEIIVNDMKRQETGLKPVAGKSRPIFEAVYHNSKSVLLW